MANSVVKILSYFEVVFQAASSMPLLVHKQDYVILLKIIEQKNMDLIFVDRYVIYCLHWCYVPSNKCQVMLRIVCKLCEVNIERFISYFWCYLLKILFDRLTHYVSFSVTVRKMIQID